MRVLLINYEYPPIGAGAATATRAIARSLVAMGHEATVLAAGFGTLAGEAIEDGVCVIRLPSRRRRADSATVPEMASFMAHAAWNVREVVRSKDVEGIIAFFSIPGGPVALWASRDTGVPYVVSLRGGDVPGAEPGLGLVHRGLAPLRRWILRSARAVVANSEGLRTLSERADPAPVLVIPNGVDTSFFVPPSDSPAKKGPARLLFIGRFQQQKNLFWLLEQVAQVRRSAPAPFTLELVGDGPQRDALSARVGELNLSGIVNFHGWQDRDSLRAHYQAASLVINPSLYEGMPNVVLEAMACGCPILASRVPGNESVVSDGVTGWLFDLDDEKGFCGRISSVLEQPMLAASLGAAGRKRAEGEFSWARTANSYLELLNRPSPDSHKS